MFKFLSGRPAFFLSILLAFLTAFFPQVPLYAQQLVLPAEENNLPGISPETGPDVPAETGPSYPSDSFSFLASEESPLSKTEPVPQAGDPVDLTLTAKSAKWVATEDGGWRVGTSGHWLTYTADVTAAGDYTLKVDAKNYTGQEGWHLPWWYKNFQLDVHVDGVWKGLLSIPASDAEYQTGVFELTGLAAGTHTIKLTWKNDGWDQNGKGDANIQIGTVMLENNSVPPPQDVTPPVISEARAENVTETGAEIKWTTDEPSASVVEIFDGVNWNAAGSDAALVTAHSIVLTGLNAETAYQVRVKSKDEAGNEQVSDPFGFTTLTPPGDTTPPVISEARAENVTETGAEIKWTTDEPSDSVVEIFDGVNWNAAGSDAALVTAHSIVLTGLNAEMAYQVRLKSKDEAGNEQVSAPFSFTTLTPPDTTPPVISGLSAAGVTQTSASIEWTTDEAADSVVEVFDGVNWNAAGSDAALVTAHSIALSGLTAGTAYQVRVKSMDAAGNESMAGPLAFTTQEAPSGENPEMTLSSKSDRWVATDDGGWRVGTSGHWLTYTTDVASAGDYTLKVSAKNYNGQEGWHLPWWYKNFELEVAVDGVKKGLLRIPASDTAYQTGEFELPGLTAGAHTIKLTWKNDGWDQNGKGDANIQIGTVALEGEPVIPPQDMTPPVISAAHAENVTETGAEIKWTTDEPSDSVVEVFDGVNWNAAGSDAALVTAHSITLTGLNAETAYQVRVKSKDEAGNEQTSDPFGFTTLTPPDTTPPVISGVESDAGSSSVSIRWITDEPASSRIEYGTGLSYGGVVSSAALTGSHELVLSGLRPEVTYHYRVISTDEAGNEKVSGDFSFKTDPFTSAIGPTLFLDFDGTYLSTWGGYSDVTVPVFDTDGNPDSFSASEQAIMEQVLSAVTEKFSIFNVKVSLDDPFAPFDTYSDPAEEFAARDAFYEDNIVEQIAIGGSSSGVLGIGAAGGIAYLNSFTNFLENTVMVFPDNLARAARYIWEAAAHEAAHGFGARHQSLYNSSGSKTTEYNPGANGVAPILGNSYDKRGLWWVGTSTSSTTIQNDMEVIARSDNGFGYRADDYGDTPGSAAAFPEVFGTAFGAHGIIGSNSDADLFEFTLTEAGSVTFGASVARYGAMLDLRLELLDAGGNILTVRDSSSLGESIVNYALTPGTYYLAVKSHAGYPGDVGQYWIDGTVPPGTTTG